MLPEHNPPPYRDLDRVKHYNQWIGLYLWLGIILPIVSTAILLNWIQTGISIYRRRLAGQYAGTPLSPPKRWQTEAGPTLKYAPAAIQAFWRKLFGRKISWLEQIHLTNLGQITLIGGFMLAVVILVVSGAEGQIDYIAHHCARTMFSLFPLVIGLAGKNNLLSYVTGFCWSTRSFSASRKLIGSQ